MWTVFSAKDTNRGFTSHAMVFVILCLYILDMVPTAFNWAFLQEAFIDNGWNFWTVFAAISTVSPKSTRQKWLIEVSGLISTLFADASMIWRCWIVWGHHWLIVLLPILCLLTGTALTGNLAMKDQSAYGTFACNSSRGPFFDILAAFGRGITPTLIVGRVAAGHARPKESWEGSISSSLHFRHDSEDQSQGTIDSDVEGGTVPSEEGQSSASPADSSEPGQGVDGQEDETGQIVYVEIV
ncbi:hypothetical protein IW262DRAFT_1301994 [Armillaria fumosa]|nr:hypothetical protein IW262DRAFT_1301994 [Armillaria fumosa]